MLLRGPAVYTVDLKRLDIVRKSRLQSKQGQNFFPTRMSRETGENKLSLFTG